MNAEQRKKVFLGGTCNGSLWRESLIPLLEIAYFNPVVPDWTPEHQEEELRQRMTCDIVLYVITPLMTGAYSIAEAVDDSNKRPSKTVFVVVEADGGNTFSAAQLKSLTSVKKLIALNGAKVVDCAELADVLNAWA